MVTKACLIIVTVLHLSLFAFANNNYYFIYPKDTTIAVNNNIIKLSGVIDSIFVTDPVTGEERIQLDYNGSRPQTNNGIVLFPVPVQLNGEKIYSPYTDTAMRHCAKLAKGKYFLAGHLQRKMKMHYKKLSGAGYNADIRNIVVSKEGRIVYSEYSGLYKTDTFNPKILKQSYLNRIDKKAKQVLDKVDMKPATVNKTVVPYRIKHYELL